MTGAVQQPLVAGSGRRVPRWWWLAAFLAVAIAGYSLRYVALGERAYVPELAASFRARPLTVLTHTLFGPIALLSGLVNLLPAMRNRRRWAAHRWIGRTYLISVLALGLAGLVMSFHAVGGVWARVGFALLALATLATSVQAYRFIKRRDIKRHREWMLRSYALIFGAVTLRIWLPILIVIYGGQFIPAYQWVAWLSWVPNLLFVEWIIRRGWHPRFVPPERFVVVAIVLVSLACASSANTREGRIPGEREDCRAAATQLAANKATVQTFRTLGWCDETGPVPLASVWRSLPSDTVRLRAFLGATANLRDGRIFSAAYAAASDTARRARDRAAALLVLVGQVDSTVTVSIVPSTRAEVWRAQLARESHPSVVIGKTPLPQDARARVAALVKTIGAGRPTGAAGLRDPLGVAVQAARVDLDRRP